MNEQTNTLKKELILQELQENLGNVQNACKKVGISRTTHYKWCKDDPEYKEKVESTIEEQIDYTESKLLELISGVKVNKGDEYYTTPPNVTAIIFYLKTKGRHRGYSENVQRNDNTKIEVFYNRTE